jgi:hypothetical protein
VFENKSCTQITGLPNEITTQCPQNHKSSLNGRLQIQLHIAGRDSNQQKSQEKQQGDQGHIFMVGHHGLCLNRDPHCFGGHTA